MDGSSEIEPETFWLQIYCYFIIIIIIIIIIIVKRPKGKSFFE